MVDCGFIDKDKEELGGRGGGESDSQVGLEGCRCEEIGEDLFEGGCGGGGPFEYQ